MWDIESGEVKRLAGMVGRDVYGKVLAKLGEDRKEIVVLGADTLDSCRGSEFEEKFPERTFNVGIAEANMVSMAAGLATCNKIPFVNAYGFLLSMRACEQVRTDICYPNLNVKFVTSMFGLIAGTAGTTHHSMEDFAIMRSFPNMTVLEASDGFEVLKAVEAILKFKGASYLRVGRDKTAVYQHDYSFQIGKAVTLKEGQDATIFACGIMVSEALKAAEALREEKISASVINMHTLKPIDRESIVHASKGKAIVTAEEHSIIGGLGSAVAEVIAEERLAVAFKRIGIQDMFCGIGPTDGLRKKHGLTYKEITKAIIELI